MGSGGHPGWWDLPIPELASEVEKLGRGHHGAAPAASAVLQARVALETSAQQEQVSDRLVAQTSRLVSSTDRLVSATRGMKRATFVVAIVGALGVLIAAVGLLRG